jgi:hypothetical protein
VSRQLKQEVSEGWGLSDAMAKQPRIFSDLYVNMVKAGESSGALVDVLRRMADHFEKFAQVQAKFTSALIYPALVCCVGVGMIVFFLTVMLPKFMSLFGDVGFKNLPMMTVILINISDAFRVENEGTAAGPGGVPESLRPVRAHALHAPPKRRAHAHRAQNHGAGHSQLHHQGGHGPDTRRGNGRQIARAAAGGQQGFSAADGGSGQNW